MRTTSSSAPFEFAPLERRAIPALDGVGVATPAELLAAAHAEADQIRTQAREEGLAAGYADGVAAAEQRLAPAAAALDAAHAQLGAERERVAERVEAHAVELALHVAERVLAGSLAVQPERVVDVVRGALRRLLERDRVLVLVHPEDLELVRSARTELVATLGGIGELDVQAERRVARGGAIVRTATGEVDATLRTKLDRARTALEEAL